MHLGVRLDSTLTMDWHVTDVLRSCTTTHMHCDGPIQYQPQKISATTISATWYTTTANRKHVCMFLLVINSNLDPILHRFRDAAAKMSKIVNFPHPTPIPAKIWDVPYGIDP